MMGVRQKYVDIKETKVKCPKCKSKDLLLVEVWKGHTIQWEQLDGVFDLHDGVLEAGNPFKVECRCCKCNYMWTVKNAKQISYLYQSKTSQQ